MARHSGTRSILVRTLVAASVAASMMLTSVHAQFVDGECATPGNDGTVTGLSGIVNTYYPGTASAAAGARCISVGTATGASTPVAAGDLLLVIQMQHATIDSGNDQSYGDNVNGAPGGVTNNQNVGTYEFVEARGAVGVNPSGFTCTAGQIAIQGRGTSAGLLNAYTNGARATNTGRQTFQVIRVPQYRHVTLGGALTAAYWNGSTGGIVVIDAVGRTDVNGFSISATGRGFRGGGGRGLGGDGDPDDADYRSPVTDNAHGAKGEGIAGTTRYLYNQETGALINFAADEGYNNGGNARGAPGNAGGGGTDDNPGSNDQNSGGGGGANGGAGGIGGNSWNTNVALGGHGGGAFVPGTPALNRIIMGGGGGAGARNNSVDRQSSGGAGGGIIIVQTGEFRGTGSIVSLGTQGPAPDNDGGGGGGAGGTVVLRDYDALTTSNATGITISVAGAAGSLAWATEAPGAFPGARHGPGGGGGGGRILLGPSLATGTTTITGGAAGTTTTAADTYGAGPGLVGTSASFTGTPPGIRPGFECAPLPVTLAHVDLRATGGGVSAEWSTAAERNTVGFQWFADEAALVPVQDGPTPSERGNTTEPTFYQATIRASRSGEYWLGELDHRGHRTMFGPYHVGQSSGQSPANQTIDWASINAEFVAARGVSPVAQEAQLRVSERGFQRVHFEELLAAGIDLSGASIADLTVLRGETSLPRHIESDDAVFGPGDFIDFFADPRDSIYGKEAVHRLVIAPGMAELIDRDDRAPGTSLPAWTLATSEYAPQNAYNFASPTADPWYADRLLAYAGSPVSKDVSLPVSAVAEVTRPAQVVVSLLGGTNLSGEAPDHHVRLAVDGFFVQETTEDGLVAFGFDHQLMLAPARTALDVRVNVTGATPYPFDLVNLESVTLRYPRLPVAAPDHWFGEDVRFGGVANDTGANPPDGALLQLLSDGFEGNAANPTLPSLRVRGLHGSDVVAYVRSGGAWRRMGDVRVAASGASFDAFVPTVVNGDDVFVATESGFHAPRITTAPAAVDIRSGIAQYLVIAHPQFADAAEALVAHRQAQGLTTDIVDVEQIYAQFGLGEADPSAIRDYITFATANRRTRYVLLVGGDTYDYQNHLGIGSISFIPSIYAATSDIVLHAPLDALFADGDGDGVPNLAIGRLPVRTVAELQTAIAKIIQSESPRANHEALLVSGASDPGTSFSGMNSEFATALPSGWSTSQADVDGLGVAAARAALFSGWAQSPALVSYTGHSAPGQWTYDPLLTAADVDQLAGTTPVPTVVQWGCWNTYYVSPSANSLGQALLLKGNHGAAAVFGAVSLTDISGHRHLAPPMLSRFESGRRIGDAILEARLALAAQGIRFVEPMLGANLLGDPAMVLP